MVSVFRNAVAVAQTAVIALLPLLWVEVALIS